MPCNLLGVFRRIVHEWEKYQVELHGQYSVQRLQALTTYAEKSSYRHIIAVLLLTPLPSLVLIVFADVLPLNDPVDGLENSQLFWIRLVLLATFMTMLIILQFRHYIDEFRIKVTHVVAIAILTSWGTGLAAYAIATLVGFPLPFIFISMGPIYSTLLFAGFMASSSRFFSQNSKARRQLINAASIFFLQIGLAVVYPACNAGFVLLQGLEQTIFALVFPLIKLMAKNGMAWFCREMEDLKPEVVVMNVEIFHALFVTYCMQGSTTILTTGVKVATDFSTFGCR